MSATTAGLLLKTATCRLKEVERDLLVHEDDDFVADDGGGDHLLIGGGGDPLVHERGDALSRV